MKCKDMKKEIKRLNAVNRKLKQACEKSFQFDDHVIDFNLLEIIVRPSRRFDRLVMPEFVGIDLSVIGGPNEIPTIHTYKTINLSALEVLIHDKQSFVEHIGKIMAAELLKTGEEVTSHHEP